MSRKDWMAPYRKPAFGPTEGHKHDCGHNCKCHLFPEHSPLCKKCREKAFEKYKADQAAKLIEGYLEI